MNPRADIRVCAREILAGCIGAGVDVERPAVGQRNRCTAVERDRCGLRHALRDRRRGERIADRNPDAGVGIGERSDIDRSGVGQVGAGGTIIEACKLQHARHVGARGGDARYRVRGRGRADIEAAGIGDADRSHCRCKRRADRTGVLIDARVIGRGGPCSLARCRGCGDDIDRPGGTVGQGDTGQHVAGRNLADTAVDHGIGAGEVDRIRIGRSDDQNRSAVADRDRRLVAHRRLVNSRAGDVGARKGVAAYRRCRRVGVRDEHDRPGVRQRRAGVASKQRFGFLVDPRRDRRIGVGEKATIGVGADQADQLAVVDERHGGIAGRADGRLLIDQIGERGIGLGIITVRIGGHIETHLSGAAIGQADARRRRTDGNLLEALRHIGGGVGDRAVCPGADKPAEQAAVSQRYRRRLIDQILGILANHRAERDIGIGGRTAGVGAKLQKDRATVGEIGN